MNWVKYIWIVFLIIAYLIWTIKCIIDFIEDKRSCWKLSFYIEQGASWFTWLMIHLAVIFIFSFAWFISGQ